MEMRLSRVSRYEKPFQGFFRLFADITAASPKEFHSRPASGRRIRDPDEDWRVQSESMAVYMTKSRFFQKSKGLREFLAAYSR